MLQIFKLNLSPKPIISLAQLRFISGLPLLEVCRGLNYCSQNGGSLHENPYRNGNPTIGARTIRILDYFLVS